MPTFDITSRPVIDLTGRSSGSFTPTNRAWDCAVNDLPFLFARQPNAMYRRGTSEWRQQRVDQEREPGDHSLDSGLWRRGASSWHLGAGLARAEPLEIDAAEARFQFGTSLGVDPWTRGQLSLLQDHTLQNSTSGWVAPYGTNSVVLASSSGGTVYRKTRGVAATSATWGGAGSIQYMTDDGSSCYLASASDGIYKMSMASGSGSKIWTLGANTNIVMGYVKQRLMLAQGADIYELNVNGTGGPALPTTYGSGKVYTHPNANWRWTAFAEGPTAIYAAGYAGNKSAIYRFDLSTTLSSGALPYLTAGVVVAELPTGEVIHSLLGYLGAYMIIGTSAGIRVGQLGSSQFVAGPLLWRDSAVYHLAASGNYVYGSTTLSSGVGLVRVDLSSPLADGFFPYATDAQSAVAGTPAQAFAFGDGMIGQMVQGSGAYWTSGAYVSSGTLTVPKIGFDTNENKSWADIQLSGVCVGTSRVSVSAALDNNSSSPVGSLDVGATSILLDLTSAAPTVGQSLTVTLTLVKGSGSTDTPYLYGYVVSALPAPRRTRTVEADLMCFDLEKDRLGNVQGYDGSSWDRLSALEELEDVGAIVRWSDFTTGENRNAVIEKVEQVRSTAPSNPSLGAGGIVRLTLRLT